MNNFAQILQLLPQVVYPVYSNPDHCVRDLTLWFMEHLLLPATSYVTHICNTKSTAFYNSVRISYTACTPFLYFFSIEHLSQKLYQSALVTFLRQEVDRMNKLLEVVSKSLTQLSQAVKGDIIMSEELEDIYQSILEQKIPLIWRVSMSNHPCVPIVV